MLTKEPITVERVQHERRDKRTVWFYVANAFSILLEKSSRPAAKMTI
jgi:hypothetical protein